MHTNAFSKPILHGRNPESWKDPLKQDIEKLWSLYDNDFKKYMSSFSSASQLQSVQLHRLPKAIIEIMHVIHTYSFVGCFYVLC